MLQKVNPTQTRSWQKLNEHFAEINDVHLKGLFASDPERFNKFHVQFKEILVDYFKNRITDETLKLLLELAEEAGVPKAAEDMFTGEKINETENRAVLHVALRNRKISPIYVEGINVMPQVNAVLQKMEIFSNKIRPGAWKGYTSDRITDIVQIGIGGSDLGPFMVAETLKPYAKKNLSVNFVSNVDGTHISETLNKLNPETTLFIVASKVFNTNETIANAYSAQDWFLKPAKDQAYITKHFVAISPNTKEVKGFGINKDNFFEFWDWVGGRFSLWSAIGLSNAFYIRFENFEELLQLGYGTCQHFKNADSEMNVPVIQSLIGIWHNYFFGAKAEGIIPYDQFAHRSPAYFQQGNMEGRGYFAGDNALNRDADCVAIWLSEYAAKLKKQQKILLEDRQKYFEIKDKLASLKITSKTWTIKNKLKKLLPFLGAKPIEKEKIDNSFRKKHKRGFVVLDIFLLMIPAVIAIIFTLTYVYLLIINHNDPFYSPPKELGKSITTIISYYFGVGAAYALTRK